MMQYKQPKHCNCLQALPQCLQRTSHLAATLPTAFPHPRLSQSQRCQLPSSPGAHAQACVVPIQQHHHCRQTLSPCGHATGGRLPCLHSGLVKLCSSACRAGKGLSILAKTCGGRCEDSTPHAAHHTWQSGQQGLPARSSKIAWLSAQMPWHRQARWQPL